MLHLIGVIVFGFVVGVIARLLMPGRDPGGFIVTILLGVAGSLVGTYVGRAFWHNPSYSAGWIGSIVGAIVLLAIYHLFRRSATRV